MIKALVGFASSALWNRVTCFTSQITDKLGLVEADVRVPHACTDRVRNIQEVRHDAE